MAKERRYESWNVGPCGEEGRAIFDAFLLFITLILYPIAFVRSESERLV